MERANRGGQSVFELAGSARCVVAGDGDSLIEGLFVADFSLRSTFPSGSRCSCHWFIRGDEPRPDNFLDFRAERVQTEPDSLYPYVDEF